MTTSEKYDKVIQECRKIFELKLQDYGPAWRILRPSSITDQLLIKAMRIRTIEVTGEAKVNENIRDEFIGLINYSVIGLIQNELGFADKVDIDNQKALQLYDKFIKKAKEIMLKKNHDYGEAWKLMRVSSFTDLILMKIHRLKQIEENKGELLVSEGPENNYFDIINYSAFALIKLSGLE